MSSFSPASASAAPRQDHTAPVLAIDYGQRRIGLAISDALGLTARPFATMVRTNRRSDMQRLREVVREHGVRRVIVGHPLHLDGSPSELAAETARFAARLHKQWGLPVELVDERLTSWEAEQMLTERKGSARKGRATRSHATGKAHDRGRKSVDDLAAAILLRDYLEHKRTEQAAGKPSEARAHARAAAPRARG